MPHNQHDHRSVRAAMDALTRTTGLATQLLEPATPELDGMVRISADHTHSVQLPYEVKTTVDRRDQLTTYKALHKNALLITRALSSTMSECCRTLGIQFVDHAGNCYLRQQGLFVFVTGLKDAGTTPQAGERGLAPAALRVVFAVLTQPSLLNSNVRRIAEVASISNGAAGAALVTLEQMGLFTSTKSGRMIVSPQRWLDIWTEGYLGRIKPKLEKHRMSAPGSIASILERVPPKMHEISLGGEAAAAHRNMGLKPATLTLYLNLKEPGIMRTLAQGLKLQRDPEGNIEIVNMFWNTQALPCFPNAPDALIYADLVGMGDQRAMEIAMQLKMEISQYVATAA